MNGNIENNNNQKKRVFLLWILLPVSFLLGLFLYPFLFKATVGMDELKDIKTMEQVEEQADSLYQALQKELEFYRTQSDSLNPDIFSKEEELEKQYIRLQSMIAEAKKNDPNNTAKIKELKDELLKLRNFVDEQTLSFAEIRRQNHDLLTEKLLLAEKLKKEAYEKELLEKENTNLVAEKKNMNEKVFKASVLRVSGLKAEGAKLSSKGDRSTDKAKQTEYIKVCFNIVKNVVVNPGVNKFHLLITDPTGWPIVVESRGSGKIDLAEPGRNNTFYTVMKSFNYNPDLSEMCLSWSQVPNKPFEKGEYKVEVFNGGYQVGETTLVLK